MEIISSRSQMSFNVVVIVVIVVVSIVTIVVNVIAITFDVIVLLVLFPFLLLRRPPSVFFFAKGRSLAPIVTPD